MDRALNCELIPRKTNEQYFPVVSCLLRCTQTACGPFLSRFSIEITPERSLLDMKLGREQRVYAVQGGYKFDIH